MFVMVQWIDVAANVEWYAVLRVVWYTAAALSDDVGARFTDAWQSPPPPPTRPAPLPPPFTVLADRKLSWQTVVR